MNTATPTSSVNACRGCNKIISSPSSILNDLPCNICDGLSVNLFTIKRKLAQSINIEIKKKKQTKHKANKKDLNAL